MKNGQVEKHEKEVYDALYLYFDKILSESGYLNTVLELGKEKGDDEYNRWLFEQENMSGAFMFTFKDIEVYATPYWEYSEGVSYAVYKDGEPFMLSGFASYGVLRIVVTGNSEVDVEAYIRLVDNLIESANF